MNDIDPQPGAPATPLPAARRQAELGEKPVALFLPCAAGAETLLADEAKRLLGDQTQVRSTAAASR